MKHFLENFIAVKLSGVSFHEQRVYSQICISPGFSVCLLVCFIVVSWVYIMFICHLKRHIMQISTGCSKKVILNWIMTRSIFSSWKYFIMFSVTWPWKLSCSKILQWLLDIIPWHVIQPRMGSSFSHSFSCSPLTIIRTGNFLFFGGVFPLNAVLCMIVVSCGLTWLCLITDSVYLNSFSPVWFTVIFLWHFKINRC